VFRLDQMKDNMGSKASLSSLIAEPFVAVFVGTFDDTVFISQPAI